MTELSHNEQREAIMQTVGRALDQWSHVELALEDLFATALGITEGPAHIVLSSIRSFNARLLVVHNLMTGLAMSPEIQTSWSNLYNQLAKKNDRRNELAHFTIIDITENGKTRVALKPYFSTGSELLRGTRNPMKPQPPGLDLKQVKERAASFSKLALEVRKINWPVRELIERRKASHGQSRDQAHQPDTPSDHTPKALQSPPQP